MLERDLFIAAWDIDDATGQRAYLDSVCTNNARLRNRLERLLSHARNDSDFLDQPAVDLCSHWDSAWPSEASSLPQTAEGLVTEAGAAGDTDRTVLLSPGAAPASPAEAEVRSSSQLGTLFGRYRLERILGAGGMGIVYLAEDMRLGRRVALKIPKFDMDGTLHLIERFRREARTMASVLHRHICPIFDVDEQDGQHYMTMAFINGETLSLALKRGATFSTSQIADLVRKLALALEAAHCAGVVHRDLKPANVMIDHEGEPIVMDFGLAWMVHETDAHVTQSGAIIGTPAYMSPEQAEGDPDQIGAPSDIYSLGAMLYELLAGRPVHTGSVTRVLYQLRHDEPTRPSVMRRNIDPQLEAICWKAIARRPEDRYASARAFAEALSAWHESHGAAERRVPPPLAPAPSRTAEVPETSTPILGERGQNASLPRRSRQTVLAGFAASMLVAAVLLFTTRNGTVVVTAPGGKLPEDIRVVVIQGGEEIELLQADNHWSAKLANGEYQVQLRGGEDRFEITNSQLTIKRLGRAAVEVVTRPTIAVPRPYPAADAPETPEKPSIASAKPAVPVHPSKPFVVVREGKDLRTFKNSMSAINDMQPGDIIEIRSNERFSIQFAEPITKPLAIRAGSGFRPWLEFVGKGTCDIKADFAVEGCDLDLRSSPFASVDPKDVTWRFHRCRMWGDPNGLVSKMRVSDSLIISNYGMPAPIDGTSTDYEFDNCLIRNHNSLMRYQNGGNHTLRLRNCTFYAVARGRPRLAFFEKEGKLTVEATGNVFHCQSQATELIEPRWLPHVTWVGADNCFSGSWYQIWEGNVLKAKGLSEWNKLWKEPERNSREVDFLAFEWGRIQRLANPERSLAIRAATEEMIAKNKLGEVGPDWNVVGPGAAYVRALAAEGRAVPESELRPEQRDDGPIVLLRAGKEVRGYLTLKPALDAAQDQDVIELRTDGLIKESSWTGDSRLLTIRAGAGYTPRIDSRLESTGTDRLILEGLTIRHPLLASGDFSSEYAGEKPLYPTRGSIVRMMNCTQLPEPNKSAVDGWLFGDGVSIPEIVNCDLGFLRIGLRSGSTARLRNSVLAECRPNVESRTAQLGKLEIERCVFWLTEPELNVWSASLQSLSAIAVQAHRSIFVSPVDLTFAHPRMIDWTGTGNVFVKPLGFHHGKESLQLKHFQTEFQTEADSIELPPWEFDPAQWRILRDKSPGYQPRPDGTDYGANIDGLINALKPTADRLPADALQPAIAPFNRDEARAYQAAWAKHFDVPVEYTNSIGMKFVLIPPGEFTMGSPLAEVEEHLKDVSDSYRDASDFYKSWKDRIQSATPQHKVVLTKPAFLGIHEVTQWQYEKVMGTTPSHFSITGAGRENVANLDTQQHPVESVSWNNTVEFCVKLSKTEKLKPFYFQAGEAVTPLEGNGYRLPNEAEWEFACRAGTITKFWNGDSSEDRIEVAWSRDSSGARTHPVGKLLSNPFGLFDVHGNVFEWVEDSWEKTCYQQFSEKGANATLSHRRQHNGNQRGIAMRSRVDFCKLRSSERQRRI